MIYLRQELKRLWEVRRYKGDRNAPDVEIEVETIIAWNQVDAIRHACGDLADQPKALHFVTPAKNEGDPVFRINSPKVGPIGDPIVPSIRRAAVAEKDWK